MKQNIILGIAILALIVSLVGGKSAVKLSGTTNYDDLKLSSLTVTGVSTLATTTTTGSNMILSGILAASSTISSDAGISGTTGTFSGAVSGTTGTFTGFGKFGSAASSTIQVGAASKAGCIILGDSANAATPVYIIASGATIVASTTKPLACQAVQ